jgi:hypothetical protein
MRKLIIVITLIMSGHYVMSQTADLGAQIAAATYWGDIENAGLTKSASPLFGILGRWNFNKRLAVRGQLFTGSLKADGIFSNANIGQSSDHPANNEYPIDILARDYTYSFSRTFQSVEALLEFNFRNYKLGSTTKENFTPFVAIGAGVFFSRALRTGSFILEPWPSTLIGGTTYLPYFVDGSITKTNGLDVVTLTIPVGFGIKYNLSKRLGGVFEVIVRKTFSDNIDNLDDPKRFQFDPKSPDVLNGQFKYDPKVNKIQLNNNDWYATVGFSICYQVWSSKGVCSIYDKDKK